MIYIFVATKAEAQAFVDKYKLQKKRHNTITYFEDEKLRVIITGIGVQNAIDVTTTIKQHFALTKKDTIYNIGIAAANTTYAIGAVVPIKECHYKEHSIKLPNDGATLTTLDAPLTTPRDGVFDMEGYGVAFVFSEFDLYIYKVISDHAKPEMITKDAAKKLVFDAMSQYAGLPGSSVPL